jgi:hypothetical protein
MENRSVGAHCTDSRGWSQACDARRKCGHARRKATRSATCAVFRHSFGAIEMTVLCGPRGTSADCVVVMDTLTGKGAGTCELSTGAVYRIV